MNMKETIKSLPFLGSFLVRIKRSARRLVEIARNSSYYTRANLDRSEGELLINDTSHTPSAGRGLFSLFREVLDVIASNGQRNIRVEYYRTLYNTNASENMWEYYFYPVRNDIKKKYIRFFTTRPYRNVFSTENKTQLALFHEVLTDRIRIKEGITRAAEQFWRNNLAEKKVIGIHYRGTDIHITTDMYRGILKEPRVEEYFVAVDALLAKGYDTILLATDDEKIFQKFKSRYGEKLISHEIERSHDGRALHFFNSNKRQQGEDVIVDAFLLSKCDFFLYGCSNVSTVVKYLNPSLPGKNMSLV